MRARAAEDRPANRALRAGQDTKKTPIDCATKRRPRACRARRRRRPFSHGIRTKWPGAPNLARGSEWGPAPVPRRHRASTASSRASPTSPRRERRAAPARKRGALPATFELAGSGSPTSASTGGSPRQPAPVRDPRLPRGGVEAERRGEHRIPEDLVVVNGQRTAGADAARSSRCASRSATVRPRTDGRVGAFAMLVERDRARAPPLYEDPGVRRHHRPSGQAPRGGCARAKALPAHLPLAGSGAAHGSLTAGSSAQHPTCARFSATARRS